MAPLTVSYGIDHDLYIVWVCVWRDAVTKVEDVWSTFEGVDDAFGFLDQVIAPCDHVRRGEVALDAAVRLDVLGDPFGADAVVDCDAVCARCFGKADIPITRFAWEGDHGDAWMALFQRLGDFSRRL